MSDVRELLMSLPERTYHVESVELPDGSTREFRIQSLTNEERAKWLEERFDRKTGKPKALADIQVSLIQKTLVDDQNNLVFKPTDRQAMKGKNGAVFGQLYEAAFAHCRLAPKFMEDEAKNLSETDEDDSKSES